MAEQTWRRLVLRDGAHWPKGPDGARLLRKANRVARDLDRRIFIVSGRRNNYEQWVAYQDYLRGGVLAARCCGKSYPHAWDDCGRQCASNHCRSRAIDCGVLSRHGKYVSLGLWKGAIKSLNSHGLTLPLYPTSSGRWLEPWHLTEKRYPG